MSLTPTQLANRRIGGSTITAVMGLSKFRTRYGQWLIDTGQEEQENLDDNIHIIAGNKLEPAIRDVQRARGFTILEEPEQLAIPEFPFYSGLVDGYNDDTVHEIKTVLNWRKDFGPDLSDDIPLDYAAQIQWYMIHKRFNHAIMHACFMPIEIKELVARVEFTHDQLCGIVENLEMRTYYIEPDALLQDQMLEEATIYWKHVQDMTTPPLLDAREVQQRYLDSLPYAKPATDEDLRNLTELNRHKELEKEAKRNISYFKDKLAVSFAENGVLTYDGKKVATYKTQNTNGFDIDKCKAEHDLHYYYDALNIEKVRRDFPEYIKKARVLR